MTRKDSFLIYRVPFWDLAGDLFEELELESITLKRTDDGRWEACVKGLGGPTIGPMICMARYDKNLAVELAVQEFARAAGYEVDV